MSIAYIRDTYGVPAKIGGRVRYTEPNGGVFNCTIKSARGGYLSVLVDDRINGYRHRLTLHPTWNVQYLPATAPGPIHAAEPDVQNGGSGVGREGEKPQ